MRDRLTRPSLHRHRAGSRPGAAPRGGSPAVESESWLGRAAAYLLFATVALAPLPFGSREPTPVAICCLVMGAALAICPARRPWRTPYVFPAAVLVVAAGYGLVLHEQLASKPWLAAEDAVWTQAATLLGHPLQPAATVVRGEPFFAMGPPLACLLAFCLGVLAAGTRRRAVQLMAVSAVAVTAYALYGIVAALAMPDQLMWRERYAYFGYVTGPFPNRNTAAVYFGSGLVLWCVLAADYLRTASRRSPSGRFKLLHAGARQIQPLLGIGGGGMLCLLALLMTGSRAGTILSSTAALLAMGLFFRRRLRSRRRMIAIALALLALMIGILQVLGGAVMLRFETYGIADEMRLAAYRIVLRMIADRPWFGSGLGTFVDIFPLYRDRTLSLYGIWELAHSTPLEMAAELGLPLTILVGLLWLAVLATLLLGSLRRYRRRSAPIAAFCISLLALAHSAIDFSLQFPGLAIMVLALAGAGVSQSFALHKQEVLNPDVKSASAPRPPGPIR